MSLVQAAAGEGDVVPAGEGIAFGCGQRRPGTTQTGCGERAEVSSVGADRLDDHQVLVRSLDLVDLHRLEQVVGGVAQNDR